MRGLTDKKVFVTGAASGIGRATARRFLEEGARLVLCDMRPIDDTGLTGDMGAEPPGKFACVRGLMAPPRQRSPAGHAEKSRDVEPRDPF